MTGYESKRAMAQDKLAQPAQETKSVTYKEVADTMNALRKGNFSQKAAAEEVGKLKLYTAPTQRPLVGLTDADWKEIEDMPDTFDQGVAWCLARLKERNA